MRVINKRVIVIIMLVMIIIIFNGCLSYTKASFSEEEESISYL